MPIRVALPSLKEIRAEDFTVFISYIPPLITEQSGGEESLILKELKEKANIASVCQDFAKCFAWIYGGLVIYRRGVLLRKELQGYVSFSRENNCNNEGLNDLLTLIDSGKGDWCVKLGKDSVYFSSTKKEGYKWIDNVGLRFVVL